MKLKKKSLRYSAGQHASKLKKTVRFLSCGAKGMLSEFFDTSLYSSGAYVLYLVTVAYWSTFVIWKTVQRCKWWRQFRDTVPSAVLLSLRNRSMLHPDPRGAWKPKPLSALVVSLHSSNPPTPLFHLTELPHNLTTNSSTKSPSPTLPSLLELSLFIVPAVLAFNARKHGDALSNPNQTAGKSLYGYFRI